MLGIVPQPSLRFDVELVWSSMGRRLGRAERYPTERASDSKPNRKGIDHANKGESHTLSNWR